MNEITHTIDATQVLGTQAKKFSYCTSNSNPSLVCASAKTVYVSARTVYVSAKS